MDLSWCIICDRHCTDNNLYCSDTCQFQDNNAGTYINDKSSTTSSPILLTPPASPSLQTFYSFNQHNRSSSTARYLTHVSSNKHYQYFPHRFTPGSPNELSLFADDT